MNLLENPQRLKFIRVLQVCHCGEIFSDVMGWYEKQYVSTEPRHHHCRKMHNWPGLRNRVCPKPCCTEFEQPVKGDILPVMSLKAFCTLCDKPDPIATIPARGKTMGYDDTAIWLHVTSVHGISRQEPKSTKKR